MKLKNIMDSLIDNSYKRGHNCNTIILDRGTLMDFESELRSFYKDYESLNLQFYRGYRISEYRGGSKIFIKIE